MQTPDECQAKAEQILADVHTARREMHGQMMDPTHAMQIQMALQVDIASAQVWATLANRSVPEEWKAPEDWD